MKLKDFLKLHPMFSVVVLFALMVSATSFYLDQYLIAVAELVLSVILAVIVFFAERNSFNDLKKTIGILNSYLYSEGEEQSGNVPIPFVICSANGSVVWYNELFEKNILSGKSLSNRQINAFVPVAKLSEGVKKGSFNARYDGKCYTVYISELNNSASSDYVLYFIDDTYYKNIVEEFENSKPVVMIVSVDSLDDMSSRITQNEFTTLLSEAERLIISWFTHYQCILRKTGDGRFFVVAEKNIFHLMKNNKFDILDSVRDNRIEGISEGLTLSIGISAGSKLSLCEEVARKALDMAKGRGGDQVVINDNGTYEFFGGVATGVESKNQVQSRTYASSFEELVKHSSNVLIMGHKNSDLDALGSAVGIYEAVRALGVEANVVIDSKSTMAYALYEHCVKKIGSEMFITPAKATDKVSAETLVVVTDVMRPGLTECPEIIEKATKKVVIDHHRMSVDYMADSLLLYHEPNSSSASEMVTELIKYMPSKPELTRTAAEALLSGIYLDTKNFTLKTGVRTFDAAASLRDRGADTITVRKLFAATAEENAAVSAIVSSAEIRGSFAFARTYDNDPSVRLVAAKAADCLLDIENVDASFVIFPVNETDVAISARSYGRINVHIIMEKLGGGGHLTMAAAQLDNTTVEVADELLGNAVFDFWHNKGSLRINKKEE